MEEASTEEGAIRARIAKLVASGELVGDEPEQTWAGGGLGKRCVGGLLPIQPPQVEFEVDLPDGRTHGLHQRCHEIWLDVCDGLVKPS